MAGQRLEATRKKQPVANVDLWEPLIELVRRARAVTFRWVKGHSGDPMNDLVDALAVAAPAARSASIASPVARPAGRILFDATASSECC